MATKIPHVVNVGTGTGQVFKQETASNTNELKTIKSGTAIDVVNNASDITLNGRNFEQLLGYYWYMSYAAYAIGNPDADLQGKNMVAAGKPSDLVRLHENYNGGDIKCAICGYFYDPTNTNNNTILIKARWQTIGDNLDIAFVGAGVTLTITKPNTAGYRVFNSDIVTLSPDGAFAAGKVLFIRFKRTDADSGNTPIITHVKLNYPIA